MESWLFRQDKRSERLKEQVCFDQCSLTLRTEILKNRRYYFDKKSHETVIEGFGKVWDNKMLNEYIIQLTFDKNHLFSGSIDAKRSLKLPRKLVLNIITIKIFTNFIKIKNTRNDLAHGTKSFSEVGQNLSPSDLELYFEQTKSILNLLILRIKEFISYKNT